MTSIWVLFMVLTSGTPIAGIQIVSTTTAAVYKTEADCRAHVAELNAYWQGVASATPNAKTQVWGAQCVSIVAADAAPKVGT